jgi:G protein-coupled receptor 158
LASKITAMQDAARSHDHVQSENPSRPLGKLNNTLDVVPEKSGNETNTEDDAPVKIKRQSVSFAADPEVGADSAPKDNNSCGKIVEEAAAEGAGASIELKSRDERSESPAADRNGRYLKSGHARTHAIVINLDDKSRFTEEVTV